MTRTAVFAAGVATFGILLSGCGGDDAEQTDSATPSATAAGAVDQAVDNAKSGTFVAGFRGAFPKLAEGKQDSDIAAIYTDTCSDIKAGKSEEDLVTETKNRAGGASEEEAKAVYQTVKMLCQP